MITLMCFLKAKLTLYRNTGLTISKSRLRGTKFHLLVPSIPCRKPNSRPSEITSRRTSGLDLFDLPVLRVEPLSFSSKRRTVACAYAWTTVGSTSSRGRIGIRYCSSPTCSILRGKLVFTRRSTSVTPTTSFESPPETNGRRLFELAMARSNGSSCRSG